MPYQVQCRATSVLGMKQDMRPSVRATPMLGIFTTYESNDCNSSFLFPCLRIGLCWLRHLVDGDIRVHVQQRLMATFECMRNNAVNLQHLSMLFLIFFFHDFGSSLYAVCNPVQLDKNPHESAQCCHFGE